MKHWALRALALVAAFLTSACAFYPKRSDDFDRPTCEVYHNPLTLELVPFMVECGDDARSCLLVNSAIGPATAVASSSIVLAGNSLYWLGNRSHCSIKAFARRYAKR
jgi:hypothetical protein